MPFTLYGSDRYTAHAPPEPARGPLPVRATNAARQVNEREPRARIPTARGRSAIDPLESYAQTARPVERQPALHAHQIMSTPVTTLTPETSLLDAWALFRKTRYRHIPIVDDTGCLVGIVSDRDLLRYAAVNGRIPPYDGDSPEAHTPIATLMKPRVLTATPDTEIRQIARVLIEQHIGAMPIMDYAGRLRGIVTRSDILRALVTHAPLELWV